MRKQPSSEVGEGEGQARSFADGTSRWVFEAEGASATAAYACDQRGFEKMLKNRKGWCTALGQGFRIEYEQSL